MRTKNKSIFQTATAMPKKKICKPFTSFISTENDLFPVLFFILLQMPLFGQTANNSLDRPSGTKLRIASYNVFWGSVFPQDNGAPPLPGKHNLKDRTSSFIRINNAIKPDIWAMQEVLYSKLERDTKTIKGHLDYLNTVTSKKWNVAADERGRIVFSRYPIKWKKKIALRMFAVLIDLPDSISKEDLLLVNVHLHWKDPIQRAKEAKLTANFLKEVMNGKVSEIPSNAMLMVCGDFNSSFNSMPHRIISSINPDIDSKGKYHPILKDKQPTQLQNKSKITCGAALFEVGSKTNIGGTIDFMLFKPGSLTMSTNFIINTLTLNQKTLDSYDLKRSDVALTPNQQLKGKVPFDHLPLVADFSN